MKAASLKEIKFELAGLTQKELLEICLSLTKFKKENKELLTYLLFEASNEATFVKEIKIEISEQFSEINTTSYYFMKKSVRKILRNIKKYVRYSKKKQTEVELLIYFCKELKKMKPSMKNNTVLFNIYHRQVDAIRKVLSNLHEDLQFDYEEELNEL
ncbi:MAG: hypothetical protein HOB05_00430 [Bacteroidetes bacterium]|jgi:hypothetical protein|nr:hypothetical protein [Bacteroidota bacterium]MBT6684769.1 hypothetical protein [Bacteroidota bacterium]MBT7144287.1 hypothetical protein [Bacteroidota bacterium]